MDNNESKRRGLYKKYLSDNSISIPASTLHSRLLVEARRKTQSEMQTNDPETDNVNYDDESVMPEILNSSSSDHIEYNEDYISLYSDNQSENDESLDSYDGYQILYDESENSDDEAFYNEIPFDDSDSENNDEDMDTNRQKDLPLYETAEISKRESELLIMSYALRNNLSDVALEELLDLIDCHLPKRVFISKYRYLQNFKNPDFVEYYYCDNCSLILNFQNNISFCENCQTRYTKSDLKYKKQYFIYKPLQNQLINLLNSKSFTHFRSTTEESDIVNGTVYRQLRHHNVIRDNDISITWNTDGVSLFKSSKFNIWPLQISVNELPYRIRRKNMILCGLFYGDKKPNMNMYLEPFAKEMFELSTNGFNTTTLQEPYPINVKVHCILCSVDSVARPLIQNMKQYNGSYGCSYCLHVGEHVTVGRGFARVYSYCERIQMRSEDLHEKMVSESIQQKTIIKGVKGPSIMSLVPYLDIIYSYPPEYMHACVLGIGKLFGTEWFNSANSNEEWYIGNKTAEFNDRLMAIKPPCEITRTPQPIQDNKYKANDWKNFILYYSLPCLSDLLKSKYFKHWFLFVYSLNIFLKLKISEEEIQLAATALHKFVKDTEQLYGKRFMKYNMHILLHLHIFVKNYGALWAWSAFPFEHYNGVLKKLYHGTQYVSHQICKLYSRLRYVENESSTFSNPKCSKKVQNLFTKLMNECKVKNCIEYDSLKIFGKPRRMNLDTVHKVIIQNELQKDDIAISCMRYDRFIYKHVLFHSVSYRRLIKRNNSCILTTYGLLIITGLLKVKSATSQDEKYIVIGKHLSILNEHLSKQNNFCSNTFSYIAKESSRVVCCKLSSILTKCVLVPYKEEKLCIVPLCNTVETD